MCMAWRANRPHPAHLEQVNFVLGAGVLGLPYAVSRAGILSSALTIVVVACLSLLTCSWLLEVGDRANAIQNELSRVVGSPRPQPPCDVIVRHADGSSSRLLPAFFRHGHAAATGLSEPLLAAECERVQEDARVEPRSHRISRNSSADSGAAGSLAMSDLGSAPGPAVRTHS